MKTSTPTRIALAVAAGLLIASPFPAGSAESDERASLPEAAGEATKTPSEDAAKAMEEPVIARCSEWKEHDPDTRSSYIQSRAVAYTKGRNEQEGEIIRVCVEGRTPICMRRVDKNCGSKRPRKLASTVKRCLTECEIHKYGAFYSHVVLGPPLMPKNRQAPKKNP